MKLQDIFLGIVGLLILVIWGSVYGITCWIFTGKAFPDD